MVFHGVLYLTIDTNESFKIKLRFLEISDSFLLTNFVDLTLLLSSHDRLMWGKTVPLKFYYSLAPFGHTGISIRIDLKLLGDCVFLLHSLDPSVAGALSPSDPLVCLPSI